jgi:3-carboxy-cis,cis-muconate cycloisomerase
MIALAPRIGRLAAHRLVYDACRLAREEQRGLEDVLADALGRELIDDLPATPVLLAPESYLGEVDEIIDAALATTEHDREIAK